MARAFSCPGVSRFCYYDYMLPYFAQSHNSACSLAALRSVLAVRDIQVSEEELITKVEVDYGKDFKNIWNPTIAKLAVEYGISTTMYAEWPLFKSGTMKKALAEYTLNPNGFDVQKYENEIDGDHIPEPLPLAYKEMFRAVELGCDTVYGGLSKQLVTELLAQGYLIQTSIKTEKLYIGSRPSYHSILIYELADDQVIYHDPARGAAMRCAIQKLVDATNGTGAFMAYVAK